MVANLSPIYVGEFLTKNTTFTSGSATTSQVVFQGDANEGTRLDVLEITTIDTADKDVQILFNDGTTYRLMTTVKVPLSSGNTNAIAPVNVMASAQFIGFTTLDPNGNRYMNIPKGCAINMAFTTDLTSAKSAYVHARGGKY